MAPDEIRSPERIGLLGGSFDPPHNGHATLGDACLRQLRLHKILVIVTGRPPHKEISTPFPDRLEMARRAFSLDGRFRVDSLEGSAKGPSYTVDTLEAVRRREGEGASYWLLMGSDSLQELSTWKRPEAIVRRCRLGVYGRPGFDVAGVRRWARYVDLVEGPPIDVSSTEIRRRIRRGEDASGLVPPLVWDYIRSEGLYRPPRAGD
jgi:nicotinate-nucleotide adenylyltransferase